MNYASAAAGPKAAVVSLRELCDEGRCTRSLEIDSLRQTLFACMSCPPASRRYLCSGCAAGHRREGHEVQSLGLCRQHCEASAQAVSDDAQNHTRHGRFCWCDREADGDADEMWQCAVCEDWFHLACIRQELQWVTEETEGSFICRTCVSLHPCLGACCAAPSSVPMSIICAEGAFSPPCGCELCASYVKERLPFLLADHASRTVELDAEEASPDDLDVAGDKAAVLRAISGYNSLKDKLKHCLSVLPEGHVVTPEDVKLFFQNL